LTEIDSRILVVEDHAALGRFIAAVLTGAGWQVIGPIDNHASALDAVRRRHFALAVLDWMLRGEEAIAVVDALLARGIGCLLISGYAHSILPERFRSLPFLQKPFSRERLLETVSAVAGRSL
jgi:DNA-binding response OmpR family regulator